jgi:hypothetical protein
MLISVIQLMFGQQIPESWHSHFTYLEHFIEWCPNFLQQQSNKKMPLTELFWQAVFAHVIYNKKKYVNYVMYVLYVMYMYCTLSVLYIVI